MDLKNTPLVQHNVEPPAAGLVSVSGKKDQRKYKSRHGALKPIQYQPRISHAERINPLVEAFIERQKKRRKETAQSSRLLPAKKRRHLAGTPVPGIKFVEGVYVDKLETPPTSTQMQNVVEVTGRNSVIMPEASHTIHGSIVSGYTHSLKEWQSIITMFSLILDFIKSHPNEVHNEMTNRFLIPRLMLYYKPDPKSLMRNDSTFNMITDLSIANLCDSNLYSVQISATFNHCLRHPLIQESERRILCWIIPVLCNEYRRHATKVTFSFFSAPPTTPDVPSDTDKTKSTVSDNEDDNANQIETPTESPSPLIPPCRQSPSTKDIKPLSPTKMLLERIAKGKAYQQELASEQLAKEAKLEKDLSMLTLSHCTRVQKDIIFKAIDGCTIGPITLHCKVK